ncbi:hypothetical protein ACFVIM_16665 [Streptomyces sp. NPDC057638]|uniref:hypothetical protein n=1 Tax=Streptomyces sp. NPDC057638 TaxID=3346190 RepID=UPI0036770914
MDGLLGLLAFVGVLAAMVGLFAGLALRIRRRGLAGGAMSAALASYEEAFRATAHEAHHEIRAQTERKAPLLSPDDDWRRAPGAADEPETAESPESPSRSPGRGDRSSRRPRRGLARWVGRARHGR